MRWWHLGSRLRSNHVGAQMKHSIDNMNYFDDDSLSKNPAILAVRFDSARLQAEAGIEQMYEIVSRRRTELKSWKHTLIMNACRAAFKLIHKL